MRPVYGARPAYSLTPAVRDLSTNTSTTHLEWLNMMGVLYRIAICLGDEKLRHANESLYDVQ